MHSFDFDNTASFINNLWGLVTLIGVSITPIWLYMLIKSTLKKAITAEKNNNLSSIKSFDTLYEEFRFDGNQMIL